LYKSSYQEGFSNINGAPAARAGSPHEGNFTCKLSGCHNSYPLGSKIGWITSNIPGSGYVPGQTYTVTATAASSGCTRFGFEISPQHQPVPQQEQQLLLMPGRPGLPLPAIPVG
jgi:hypothetical protein